MYVIIGHAYNLISIPAMIFKTFEELQTFIEENFPFRIAESELPFHFYSDRVENMTVEDVAKKLYISYYGGCGELDAVIIKKVAPGQKLTHFNLD